MSKLFLIWVVLAFCCFSISALAVEPSICYGAKFSEVDALSDLPVQIRQQLGVDEKGLAGIAERNKPYNVTDAVDEKLPMRRFSMAAVSSDCILVAYEQGGIGYNVSLRIFLHDGSEWLRGEKMPDPRQNLVFGFRVPRTLDEMLKYSQYAFGEMYVHGFGAEKDEVEAVKWYRLAATQGVGDAQFTLGRMYAEGRGVEKNLNEALKWFELAAKQNPHWQYLLGMKYMPSGTFPLDYGIALKWFNLAANQGDADAQVKLGLMNKAGQGVQRNDLEAVKLFRLATKNPYSTACYQLGLMYEEGRGVKQNFIVAYALFENESYATYEARAKTNSLKDKMSAEEINIAEHLFKDMPLFSATPRRKVIEVIDSYLAKNDSQ